MAIMKNLTVYETKYWNTLGIVVKVGQLADVGVSKHEYFKNATSWRIMGRDYHVTLEGAHAWVRKAIDRKIASNQNALAKLVKLRDKYRRLAPPYSTTQFWR